MICLTYVDSMNEQKIVEYMSRIPLIRKPAGKNTTESFFPPLRIADLEMDT